MADFKVINEGSILILEPQTVKAEEWIEETMPDDAQMWGKGLVVEPRYMDGVIDAAQVAGFEVAL